MEKAIYVTSPLLPELGAFIPYLQQIWKSKYLTNNGPFHQAFEQALADYLGVEHLSLFNNGTTALITALQALAIDGEVITTPYSFAATAHALVWNRLTPVFVDIDPRTFNIDPKAIEAAITPRTQAILPVHCYGLPCDVEAIEQVARRHGLRVIYDAAHAFAVQDAQGSVLRHGDMSILSLHATKVFNTFEGGAIISPDARTKHHVDQLRNFGFVDEVTVETCGINGKMSEINAAFGLLQLQHIDGALVKRESIDALYRKQLMKIPGITLCCAAQNHAYFPILVEDAYPLSRDQLYDAFKQRQVFARRYFYPLISDMAAYCDRKDSRRHPLPMASHIAQRVICLPIHPDLTLTDVERVVAVIRRGALGSSSNTATASAVPDLVSEKR
ncbi:DegT/DnrJ/EryC1/StrS family aminotransferase [Pseudomonas chlororaphis subsp. aurantiaca]|uniref:DegT/DnrJ/EryC1/StrS family aminotransferase n=1 Tax=Pseudomonas chlororaphis TaxID=587753 RepID=UPI0027DD7585|nr:DegT/DnrJ/EryC1/StrS family aminotransferase [Pseudomonas chlororaphis]WMI97607.1 DegT/DnrJ/EryC1/StrS family aminotransferase [Pseudomonas chlororaphis subsp. aurantiaca]